MSLHEAVQKKDIKSIKAILADGRVDVDVTDEAGCTALIRASQTGLVECAKILLDAKADVNKTSTDGSTPLLWASVCGQGDCVRVCCFCVLWNIEFLIVFFSSRSSLHTRQTSTPKITRETHPYIMQ